MSENERIYYSRRAQEEQSAAERASTAAAAIAHGKLAEQYAELAERKRAYGGIR